MTKSEAYLYYEAGQAVAAVHLGLKVRHVRADAASGSSDIVLPRDNPKARMILWLTGMAAERKGVGASNPLRRMRNRARLRTKIEASMVDMKGPRAKRMKDAKSMMNQAQDRANAICSNLFAAIEQVVQKLRVSGGPVPGDEVVAIVRAVKAGRSLEGKALPEEPEAMTNDK